MKNHRFPWLRNRTTDNRKCEKACNIKEKRTIEMFNTVSRQLVAQASSARDNQTPKDKLKTIVSAVVFCVDSDNIRPNNSVILPIEISSRMSIY